MGIRAAQLAIAVILILPALGLQTLWAGHAYWVMEESDPTGRRIEVVRTSGKEPQTWQADWVNYVKRVAGPFTTREDATAHCLEAAERRGSYYQSHSCE